MGAGGEPLCRRARAYENGVCRAAGEPLLGLERGVPGTVAAQGGCQARVVEVVGTIVTPECIQALGCVQRDFDDVDELNKQKPGSRSPPLKSGHFGNNLESGKKVGMARPGHRTSSR